MRCPLNDVGTALIHDIKQLTFLRSRDALLRPGFAFLFPSDPDRGAGGAPKRRSISFVALSGATAVPGEARRASSGTRSPLRRSHRGGFRSGAALPSPALPPDPCSDAPRGQVVVPGGRGPGPPGAGGYEPRPQDATPRSAFRIVSRRRPSMSEDMSHLAQARYVVNTVV